MLLMQKGELSEIPILIACMQISNHEFLVLISSILLIRTGDNHYARIDACGAWMIIHFLVAIGNVSLLTFEIKNDHLVIFNSSIIKKVLLGWKVYFVLVQVFGMIYCYYIVHKPVAYIKDKPKRTVHPLFSKEVTQRPSTDASSSEQTAIFSNSDVRQRVQSVEAIGQATRPRSTIISNPRLNNHNTNHGYNRNSCYESYQSLANVSTDMPLRCTSNPAFDSSELPMNNANHHSPYEQMMLANRDRLSHLEPVRSVENNGYGIIS